MLSYGKDRGIQEVRLSWEHEVIYRWSIFSPFILRFFLSSFSLWLTFQWIQMEKLMLNKHPERLLVQFFLSFFCLDMVYVYTQFILQIVNYTYQNNKHYRSDFIKVWIDQND